MARLFQNYLSSRQKRNNLMELEKSISLGKRTLHSRPKKEWMAMKTHSFHEKNDRQSPTDKNVVESQWLRKHETDGNDVVWWQSGAMQDIWTKRWRNGVGLARPYMYWPYPSKIQLGVHETDASCCGRCRPLHLWRPDGLAPIRGPEW